MYCDDDVDDDECVCSRVTMNYFLLSACPVFRALAFLSVAILCANVLCDAPCEVEALCCFDDYDTLREYSVRCAMRLSFQILVFAGLS